MKKWFGVAGVMALFLGIILVTALDLRDVQDPSPVERPPGEVQVSAAPVSVPSVETEASVPDVVAEAAEPTVDGSGGADAVNTQFEVDPAEIQYASDFQAAISGHGDDYEANVRELYAFLEKYPEGPRRVEAINILGDYLERLKRYEESIAAFEEGKNLSAGTPMAAVLHINEAHVFMSMEDYGTAERLLRDVLELPLADDFSHPMEVVPQLFLATEWLGRLYEAQGRYDDAEQQFLNMLATADELFERAPEDWVASYAIAAYDRRITLSLEWFPEDFDRARQIVVEQQEYVREHAAVIGPMRPNFNQTNQYIDGLEAAYLEGAAEKKAVSAESA